MASRYSIEAVFKLIDDFTKPIKKMQSQNSKFANGLKSDFAKAQRSVQQFANKLKSAVKGIGIALSVGAGLLGAGLIKVGKDAISLAYLHSTMVRFIITTANNNPATNYKFTFHYG